MKKQTINESNWDYLIILDACRYDVFKEVYSKYLRGELEKRKSPASATAGWLEQTFPGEYSYTYISANPFVNSQGLSLSETSQGYLSDWRADEHFDRVVDSWDLDWDEDLETVRPEDLTRRALKNLDGEKTIIHYMQPHRPYLTADAKINRMGLSQARKKFKEGSKLKKKIIFVAEIVHNRLWKRIGIPKRRALKRILGMEAKTEKFILERGARGLLNYYQKNLELALRWVRKLLPSLEGEVIITSDHGEAFGEGGVWWHEYKDSTPILFEVPWFKVDGNCYEDKGTEFETKSKEKKDHKGASKREIKRKLEKLGYS